MLPRSTDGSPAALAWPQVSAAYTFVPGPDAEAVRLRVRLALDRDAYQLAGADAAAVKARAADEEKRWAALSGLLQQASVSVSLACSWSETAAFSNQSVATLQAFLEAAVAFLKAVAAGSAERPATAPADLDCDLAVAERAAGSCARLEAWLQIEVPTGGGTEAAAAAPLPLTLAGAEAAVGQEESSASPEKALALLEDQRPGFRVARAAAALQGDAGAAPALWGLWFAAGGHAGTDASQTVLPIVALGIRPLTDAVQTQSGAEAVRMRFYETGRYTGTAEPVMQQIADVDAEVHARRFLNALDLFLQPEIQGALKRLAEDASFAHVPNPIQTVADTVDALAAAIPKAQLLPVFQGETPPGLSAGQDYLAQQLRGRPGAAYAANTVLQASVIGMPAGDATPVCRLAGHLQQAGGNEPVAGFSRAVISCTEPVPNLTASFSLPETSTDAQDWYAFAADMLVTDATVCEADGSEHALRLLRPWLLTGVNNAPLLQGGLPIFRLGGPEVPVLMKQVAQEVAVPSGPAPEMLAGALLWDYTVRYLRNESHLQDRVDVAVDWNPEPPPLAAGTGPELLAALLQFNINYQKLWQDLDPERTDAVRCNALESFAWVVQEVCGAWVAWAGNTRAREVPSAKVHDAQYLLRELPDPETGALLLCVQATEDVRKELPVPQVLIDGFETRCKTAADRTATYFFVPAGADDLAALRYADRGGEQHRTLLFPGNDFRQRTAVWCSMALKRNETLGDRAVAPAFRYASRRVAFMDACLPNLRREIDLNLADLTPDHPEDRASLQSWLKPLFHALFPSDAAPEKHVSGEVGYAHSVEEGSVSPVVPLLLLPPAAITVATIGDYLNNLAPAILAALRNGSFPEAGAQLHFSVRLTTSGPRVQPQASVLLSGLYLPVHRIALE